MKVLVIGMLSVLSLRCAAVAPGLADTEWVLSSMKGQPPVRDSRVTLNFEKSGAGGYSGCNWYGGNYAATGDALRFEEISQTLRGCMRELEKQETEYHRTLREIASFHQTGDQLNLMIASGETILTFTRREQLAMNPADLAGTRWKLRSVNGTSVPADSKVRLNFSSAGAIGGFAGCRDFTGTYGAKGDHIHVSSISMNETECDRGDAVINEEGQYTTDLSESRHYRLDGKTLELLTDPGRKLIFVAEP